MRWELLDVLTFVLLLFRFANVVEVLKDGIDKSEDNTKANYNVEKREDFTGIGLRREVAIPNSS